MKERPQVNIRLDRRLLDELDRLAALEDVDRSDMARRLLDTGMTSYRGDLAMREYRNGSVSAWRAAEMAGVSLYEMLDRIRQEGIPYELDPEVLGRLGARVGPASAIRERSVPYRGTADAETGIAELREQFRPDRVTTLLVGESSPAGGTHFYRADSNLFRATREAFAVAFGEDEVPSGPRFLHYFRDHGAWLVDLADRPVNQLPNDQRQSAVGEGIARLADLIRQSKPERIVSVKATIGASVVEAARLAGFAGDVVELPFPVRQWRSVFVESLAAALGSQPSVRSSRDKTLRTQPVTAKDIGRGQIRVPITGRAKSLLPKTKTKLRLSLFGREVDAKYDPHFDPDQERSGVIRVGRAALRDVVRPDDTLELSVDDSGTVHLD